MSIQYENKTTPIHMMRREYLSCEAHLHKEIEVVYMMKGQTKAYADSVEYLLSEGDLFFAFPNKVHYYETFTEEESYLLIFSPEVFLEFKNVLLKNSPVYPVLKKEQLTSDIKTALRKAYKKLKSNVDYHDEICKGYLTVFLGEVLPLFEYEPVQSSNTDMLSAMLAYCMQNYTDAISLDKMAAELHASKYYISRLFGEKIKISFNDYINMLRINDAKERLQKTDDSITEIGIAVGYNTIRSFNRAFLSQTGMQPREYRHAYRKV